MIQGNREWESDSEKKGYMSEIISGHVYSTLLNLYQDLLPPSFSTIQRA
jgi:hypothetical protein